MNAVKSISVLNQLLSIQQERLENYEINIIENNNRNLINTFKRIKKECHISQLELTNEIIAMGGLTLVEKTPSNKKFYLWLTFKSMFQKSNLEDLVSTLDYNEYLNTKLFQSILESNIQYFNFRQIEMLQNQLTNIKKTQADLKSQVELIFKQTINYKKTYHEISS